MIWLEVKIAKHISTSSEYRDSHASLFVAPTYGGHAAVNGGQEIFYLHGGPLMFV